MVHCLVIIVRNPLRCFSDLFYQRQLLYLITFEEVCQQLFLFFQIFFSSCFSGALWANTGNPCRFKVCCRQFSAASINITHINTHVNTFFQLFLHFSKMYFTQSECVLYFAFQYASLACPVWQKIGSDLHHFQSGERGIWTLAPLLTTYSLSRGAPSASWVFLQIQWTDYNF